MFCYYFLHCRLHNRSHENAVLEEKIYKEMTWCKLDKGIFCPICFLDDGCNHLYADYKGLRTHIRKDHKGILMLSVCRECSFEIVHSMEKGKPTAKLISSHCTHCIGPNEVKDKKW